MEAFMRRSTVLIFLSVISWGVFSCQPKKQADSGRPAVVDPRCMDEVSAESCQEKSKCEWLGTKCSGTAEYCGGFKTFAACPSTSCLWSETAAACQKNLPPATTPTPGAELCKNYPQEADCALVSGCSWNGTACVASVGGQSGGGIPGGGIPGGGVPGGGTTGLPDSSTGSQPPQSGIPSPEICQQAGLLKCYLVQGCAIKFVPSLHCGVR